MPLALLLAIVATACSGDDERHYQLVFDSERGGNQDIFVMRDDGKDVRQLTDAPGRDYEPNASDDGSMIVFVSDRAGGEGAQLYLMRPDGSEVRRLTFSQGESDTVVDDYPHWSPDGRTIVFQRTIISEIAAGLDADIWLIDVETGEERKITDTPDAWDSTPSFSADGRSILFESNRDGDFDLYRLDLATSRVVNLTNAGGTDLESNQSPDGSQIAFGSNRDGDFEIYVMNADGSGVRQVTIAPGNDEVPNWLVEP